MTKTQDYINLIKLKYKAILLIMALVIALVVFTTSFKPFEYKSDVQLLIIQDETKGDLYQASRATERLGDGLSKIIYSSSFYDKVIASKMIDESYFPADETQKREEWNSAIEAKVVPETSIIEISAYSTDKKKAENLAGAVAYTLSTQGTEYYGQGNNIRIKLINEPLTSKNPVRPNLFLNFALALVISFFVVIAFLLFAEIPTRKEIKPVKEKTKLTKKALGKSDIRDMKPAYNILDINNFEEFKDPELIPVESKSMFTMFDHIK